VKKGMGKRGEYKDEENKKQLTARNNLHLQRQTQVIHRNENIHSEVPGIVLLQFQNSVDEVH
jgi:hypothetical protein